MAYTFVTIAGEAVRFTEFSQLPDEVGGKMQRTLSGHRRGDVLWRARGWQGRALCFTEIESAALRVLCDDLTPRVCAGPAFPGDYGVTCHVEMGAAPFERFQETWWKSPVLTFREVL